MPRQRNPNNAAALATALATLPKLSPLLNVGLPPGTHIKKGDSGARQKHFLGGSEGAVDLP
eukprot:15303670-Alexandrium_andersonii.AAC.1